MRGFVSFVIAGTFLTITAAQPVAGNLEQAARDALANDATSPLPNGLALGLGGYYAGKSYVGQDSEFIPLPSVYYRGEKSMVYIKQATYRFWQGDDMELAWLGDIRLDGYSSSDSDFLKGMKTRNPSLDGGLQFELGTPVGELEATLTTDLLFQHEGQEGSLAYTAPIIFDRFYIKPSISLSWLSSNLVEYYYGVRNSESTPDRPAYSVDDTWGWSFSLVSNYRIAENWLLIGLMEYEGFSNDVKDSPIVSEDGEFNLFLSAAWRF